MKVPTIKVKHADGHMLINESDYDPKKHELFDAPKGKSKPAATTEEPK